MKIAIIGCGYIGSALAKKWHSEGLQITVTTRKPERVIQLQELAKSVHLIHINDNQPDFHELVMDQDALIFTVGADNSNEYESAYLKNAQALVTALKNNSSVKQIVYTSSTSIYGDHEGAWVDESSEMISYNQNSNLLMATEQCLLSLSSISRKVCIFRLGEIYGPGREIHERLKRMHHKSFPGTGLNFTNLIHVDDVVRAIDFALMKNLDGVYNLCNDLHIPRKDMYETICNQHGLPSITWDKNLPSLHGGNKKVSSAKLKQMGFIPITILQ
jgi:nucleoside-diphosphate-sugar epimerase